MAEAITAKIQYKLTKKKILIRILLEKEPDLNNFSNIKNKMEKNGEIIMIHKKISLRINWLKGRSLREEKKKTLNGNSSFSV